MAKRVSIVGLDTGTLPKITHQQSQELLLKIKNGDEDAKNYFFMCNTRLVLSITQRFGLAKENINDIFQVGCIGLLKAIDNFDINVGVRFSTYAVPMILGEIKRFLRDGSAMRVSRSIRDTAYKVLKSRERLGADRVDEVGLEEVANDLSITLREVYEAIDSVSDPLSLNEPAYNDGEEAVTLQDNVYDKNNDGDRWIQNIDLGDAIANLESREREILSLRYFVGKTQMEVSDSVGISQAQVSRLEKNALEQIKKYIQ